MTFQRAPTSQPESGVDTVYVRRDDGLYLGFDVALRATWGGYTRATPLMLKVISETSKTFRLFCGATCLVMDGPRPPMGSYVGETTACGISINADELMSNGWRVLSSSGSS